ncbi:MAG: SpoIID/LytB domain-containing protein [Clostridia bacterium]|nr:MAG: SpoIID/LytB domain-containing protein [Clostridia bacterium]
MSSWCRAGILVIAAFILFSWPVAAHATGPEVRVALGRGADKAEVGAFAGQYTLYARDHSSPVASVTPGSRLVVAARPDGLWVTGGQGEVTGPLAGPLELVPETGTDPSLFLLGNKAYRGRLVLTGRADGLLAVNVLGLEEYLYGVVGEEMGYDAPPEALKAQAVASRSYAASSLGKNQDYDLGPDTLSQVYRGYAAETKPGADRVREAVDATRGQVIYFAGKVIPAYYHANAGGYTEASENVWSQALPFLQPVPSPWDEAAAQYQPRSPDGWPVNTYQWQTSLSLDALGEKIATWNQRQLAAGRADLVISVGRPVGLEVSRQQRDPTRGETLSGRVTRLDVVGVDGTASIYRDQIRSLLDLRSTLFTMEADSRVWLATSDGAGAVTQTAGKYLVAGEGYRQEITPGTEKLWIQGTAELREVPVLPTGFTFTGRGWGHGVGMSQWGARGMALEGYKYQDIILHYYNQDHNDGQLTIGSYEG